jgi:replicative DNA helicase
VDLDKAFLSSVLSEGKLAVKAAIEVGIDAQVLQGRSKKAFAFVIEYLSKYGEIPSKAVVAQKMEIDIPEPEGNAAFFAKELLNRRLFIALNEKTSAIVTEIEKRDAESAFNAYADGLKELRKLSTGIARTVEIFSGVDRAVEYYNRMKNGERGVLTPWESLNEATYGFWPEELILFVARTNVGKTWGLVVMAECAWAAGKKVLFATTEMSQDAILRRTMARHLRLPYDDFLKGRLGAFMEPKLLEGVERLRTATGFRILGGDFDFSINALDAAVEETEPDILFIDGAYLLRVQGDNRFDKASNMFDELKRLAKGKQIPVVASTQFNRQAKANSAATATAEKIALSDAAGWNADTIIGMIQNEEMKKDGYMVLKPLKFREGAGEEIMCEWNYQTMSFVQSANINKYFAGEKGGKAPEASGDLFSPGPGFSSSEQVEVPF